MKDGREVDVEVNVTYIQWEGSPAVQGILRDISERKAVEEELRRKNEALDQANAELRELDQMKDNFISTMSHELRTPLTSIKGFIEALQEGAIQEPTQARPFLDIIARQAERMAKIIADMLLLSEIEAEGFQFKLEKLSLKELVYDISGQYEKLAARRSQRLEVSFDPAAEFILADKDKISQALRNLIDNAAKFTPPGGRIQIEVTRGPKETLISVRDTGVGIPSADLPRIFERFYTVDQARSRELGGPGLSLSIVKHIVEAHQGKVGVESELNKGSTFYFSLPV